MAAESEGDQVYFPQARPYFPSRPPAVLFYHDSMKALAESIAEKCCKSSTGPGFFAVSFSLSKSIINRLSDS